MKNSKNNKEMIKIKAVIQLVIIIDSLVDNKINYHILSNKLKEITIKIVIKKRKETLIIIVIKESLTESLVTIQVQTMKVQIKFLKEESNIINYFKKFNKMIF